MRRILYYLQNLPRRQYVRPWGLVTPILVFLVALPLLRPLRWPEPADISAGELTRLAAIQAMAENHTQAIDRSEFFQGLCELNRANPPQTRVIDGSTYSDKPPVLAKILSWIYAMMAAMGLSFRTNPVLVIYLLTLLGATIPVAACGAVLYRMSRLFELGRPYRAAVAVSGVFASGLISYSVVLNSHALAAALVLAACASLLHITNARRHRQVGVWLIICGLCASLASVIDLSASVFLVGLLLVVPVIRAKPSVRIGGVMLYVLGALPPLVFHATLTIPVTGDLLPPCLHQTPAPSAVISWAPSAEPVRDAADQDAFEDDRSTADAPSLVRRGADAVALLNWRLIGSRGLFSHFPVLIMGVAGIVMILRRHWPASTKTLALVTLVGSTAIVLVCVFSHADWKQRMFGPRWFIVFAPLLLFWAGAWLRKAHRPATWTAVALLTFFSMTIALLGACDPVVRARPGQYTPAAALHELFGH